MARKPRPKPTQTLSQTLDGYFLAARARALSEHTLADYANTFRKLRERIGDPVFMDITKTQVEEFLASQTVSKKTLLNYHTGLSALWTWAFDEGLTHQHLLRKIERPRPEKRAIFPYTEADIKAMLQALTSSKAYLDRGTLASHALPHQERNRALILLLLDTGIRAEELCSLTVANVDTRNERVKVENGKGDKGRMLPISSRTGQAIWRYWQQTRPGLQPDDPAFAVEGGLPMDRHRLRKQIVGIGKRAGIAQPDVHRFRHTFAIAYLRNGGDVYTLQDILGHTTMEMCRTYLRLAQADVQSAHRRASPVTNMRL